MRYCQALPSFAADLHLGSLTTSGDDPNSVTCLDFWTRTAFVLDVDGSAQTVHVLVDNAFSNLTKTGK